MKVEAYPDHLVLIPESPLESDYLHKLQGGKFSVSTDELYSRAFSGVNQNWPCVYASLWPIKPEAPCPNSTTISDQQTSS